MKAFIISCIFLLTSVMSMAQPKKPANDVTSPLHLLKPNYPVLYGETKPQDIKVVLDRMYAYLDQATPFQLVNKSTGVPVANFKNAGANDQFKQGDFRLISYEWGITYTGMLLAAEVTGDKKFLDYSVNRISFLADVTSNYLPLYKKDPKAASPVRSVLEPHALDDAGSMSAALIKTYATGKLKANIRPLIDNYLNYIMTKEFRLTDGTLARNRPQPNTLWLDDLYMSLPALVQMGKLTGDEKYYEEAVKQFQLYSKRMFNKSNGLYMHGWVQDMEPHPQFHWARANGWALLTKIEILDVLPENYPGRKEIMDELIAHIKGLTALQHGTGFWHQLLNKNDSYLETSATAIYSYCIARAINKGWIDAKAYGPVALLAWNAVSSKVNDKGQVEGTCVGTGMGFDPAFYYYRPVNNFAAHGYGPALMAGAEMFRLLQDHPYVINDSAVQFLK
ncbi:glycoside hydrolase family 88/105 protein [Arcticibacter eurypsychrophilus]|uniref:glycoside hydrolase family 88/105 protein n=1 Tax=Arcticibacter eurypsychrophilus TaxID=1434752 RepID=UPI00084CE8D1|nr:glycoside hydrolase family 88 protein [Arcticibacter eurypsychrophilus]